jgi:hypothetical protein
MPFDPIADLPRRFLAPAALLAYAVAGGCAETPLPPELLRLRVSHPQPPDNPFELPGADFVALIAEGPQIARDQVYEVSKYQTGKNMLVSLPQVPYGERRQVRVELLKGENGKPSETLARGWSVPKDIKVGGPAVLITPYVTKINAFAPINDDDGNRAKTDARAGAAAVALPDGSVLFAGGGVVKASSKNPYDIKNFEKFHDSLLLYDPDKRTSLSLTDAAGAKLKFARAFPGVAVGASVVAIVGGWIGSADGPKPTNSVEFIPLNAPKPEVKTSTATQNPDLVHARAAPSVVQMFEGQDFFLVLGGQGDGSCSDACAGNTWEVWHPTNGVVAKGSLNEPRWNHATVRVPGSGGGFVLLVGGENASGPLDTFEVVQFTNKSEGKVSNAASACPEKGAADCPPSVLDHWKPYKGYMKSPRVLPGAAYVYVVRPDNGLNYGYVYMLGGFADSAKTKALDSVDVLDLATGNYLDAGSVAQLKVARGAPMVAAASNGSWPGQVLVAGGSSSAGSHVNSAEFLVVKPPDKVGDALKVSGFEVGSQLVGGNRALGVAVPLVTGHVLLGGGIGTNEQGLIPQNDLMVWNPY